MDTERTNPAALHPDDGDLIRLMDAECSDVERASIESHLASCDRCAARHATLVRRAHRVREMLVMGDAAPDAHGRIVLPARRPWWHTRSPKVIALRAALLLMAVGALGASAQTVRTWMRAHWSEVRQLLRPAPHRDALPAAGPPAAVHFNPDGETLAIDVVARQAAGTMAIDIVSDTLATAIITPGTSDVAMLILPGTLRIVNRPAVMTSYVILVPTRVRIIEVRIASRSVVRLASVRAAHWVFDLAGRNR